MTDPDRPKPAANRPGYHDFAGIGRALAEVVRAAILDPAASLGAAAVYGSRLAAIPALTLNQWLGGAPAPAVDVDPRDRRFQDRSWTEDPYFYALRLVYAAAGALSKDLVEAAAVDPATREKARFAASLIVDAAAPTNFLATNPAALRRAVETGGLSVLAGLRNFLEDVVRHDGLPRKVDTSPFTLGQNLAATAGAVVYRNELMELIQYRPQTPRVHARPLLCSPPWINKYYVMDLAPGRSFIEWAVQHGRTVFTISYRNPGSDQWHLTMEDYLLQGPRRALDVIENITGARTTDIVGLCIGGALATITSAYLQATGDERLGTLTLLNTLLDYSDPGVLGVFTDEATVARLEQQMTADGHLNGASMARTFDVIRANDLIFHYVVANWLMGQEPPAFDILAWNADNTRMPAAMHSFYLRKFYVENRLAKNQLTMAGTRIRLGMITQPVYVVGAENDHIVPWQSAYAGAALLAGPVRFVLTSGGHVAGIVCPPNPKSRYTVAPVAKAEPDAWQKAAESHAGSWWTDWALWSTETSGPLVEPPGLGSRTYPVLGNAPGEYVRG